MTPEDYELLSLAALAIGCEDVEVVDEEEWVNLHFADGSTIHNWNPRRHGDDALDLAVRLELDILHRVVDGPRVEVVPPGGPLFTQVVEADRLTATREAIFRAAVEIGKKAGL